MTLTYVAQCSLLFATQTEGAPDEDRPEAVDKISPEDQKFASESYQVAPWGPQPQ